MWNLWLQLYHHRILDKETNDELRQNFISDKMQLHTSTRSDLGLVKSVIYIYSELIFYVLYFKQYFNLMVDLMFVIYKKFDNQPR